MYREFKEKKCKESDEEEIKAIWKREQLELKQHLVCEDLPCWATHRVTPANASDHTGVQPLEYIGGMNISFVKGDNVNACAALVVVKLPSLEVVYEDCSHIELTDPYIPELSAFREGKVLIDKIEKLKATSPEFMPQVILCDGNGILHAQEFGLACHVGVLLDLPAVGVSTELCQVLGVESNEEHKQKIKQLHNRLDSFPLIGESGRTLGVALRGNAKTKNPVYISPGHQLTVETAVWVVQQCCPHRVPEPVRQAAIRSRKLLYQHFPSGEHSKDMSKQHTNVPSTSKLSKVRKSKEFHDDIIRHSGFDDSSCVAMARNPDEDEAGPLDCPDECLVEADELHVEEEIKAIWEREQLELKQRLVLEDVADWAQHRVTPDNAADWPGVCPLQYLGGVDISFVKGDNVNACAALIVIELPSLEVVYEDCSHVQLTAPYIPGFLAFREVKFLIDKIEKLKATSPELMPQVILCDGNGILHPREFGIASHLGVLLDLPALGAAKKLFQVFGLEKDEEHRRKIEQLENPQDYFPLIGDTGRTLGVALRSNAKTRNPVYISPGHQLTVETAMWVVQQCCPYRVPEPVRQADLRSREFLRQHFPTEENSPKTNSKKSPSRNVKDMSNNQQ